MRLRVRPRLEPLQVAEDRPRAVEEAPVVGLERRDLVVTGALAQGVALLGPRLDLLRDEVEPELGQHLADGGGERAPLGLVERQHHG